MKIELERVGLHYLAENPIEVKYDGRVVGEFKPDLIVENSVFVELKSISHLAVIHEVQVVNYLTATGLPIGLLLNFGLTGVEIRRKVRDLKQLA